MMNAPPAAVTVKSADVFAGASPGMLMDGAPSGASIIATGAAPVPGGDEILVSLQPAITSIVTNVLTVFQLMRRIANSRETETTTPATYLGASRRTEDEAAGE